MISPARAWWLRLNSSYSFGWQREPSTGVTNTDVQTPSCRHAAGSSALAWWQSTQPTPTLAWRDPSHCITSAAERSR
jgi:hypothetical protein